MAGPWRLHLVVAADKASHLGSALCFRQKNGRVEKLGHSHPKHKTILGWKFWIQDPLHEPEVLPVSLAHLVARMSWAHAKDPDEIGRAHV